MLINIRVSELQSNTKNSIPLALFITIFFNYLVFQLLPYDLAILNNSNNGSALNNVLYHSSLNSGSSFGGVGASLGNEKIFNNKVSNLVANGSFHSSVNPGEEASVPSVAAAVSAVTPPQPQPDTGIENSDLFFATSSSWDGNLIETSHISTIGNILYTSHSMWLLLASFILLLAMIGAIVITIKPKN